jgi:hypothetical protein
MSIWTHVAALIRIDGLPDIMPEKYNEDNLRKLLGKQVLFDDLYEGRAEIDDDTLPNGSEGSLHLDIHKYNTGMPWVAVSIYGDLRAYDSVDELAKWFEDKISLLESNDFSVRDYAITIECENGKGRVLSSFTEVEASQ